MRLNERMTNRNKSLKKKNDELKKIKDDIPQNMIDNIHDQNGDDSLLALMSCFDLSSDEGYASRVVKLSKLYKLFGVDCEHEVKTPWNGYHVNITYRRRLRCTNVELLKQFEKAWPAINKLSEELAVAKEMKKKEVTQRTLWKKFVDNHRIEYRFVCKMILIMFSIPVNTGWVERGYSTLEMICQKRRNQLKVSHLKNQFFMSILRRPVRDAFSYEEEIKNIGNDTFPLE